MFFAGIAGVGRLSGTGGLLLRAGSEGGCLSTTGLSGAKFVVRLGTDGGNLSGCKVVAAIESVSPFLDGGSGGAAFALEPDPARFLLGGGGGAIFPRLTNYTRIWSCSWSTRHSPCVLNHKSLNDFTILFISQLFLCNARFIKNNLPFGGNILQTKSTRSCKSNMTDMSTLISETESQKVPISCFC